jgi:hypothetical protein
MVTFLHGIKFWGTSYSPVFNIYIQVLCVRTYYRVISNVKYLYLSNKDLRFVSLLCPFISEGHTETVTPLSNHTWRGKSEVVIATLCCIILWILLGLLAMLSDYKKQHCRELYYLYHWGGSNMTGWSLLGRSN